MFALLSYFSWGVGDIVGTVASRKLGAFTSSFWGSLISLFLFALYAPFAFNDLKGITGQVFLINIVTGVLFLIGFLSYFKALSIDNAPLVGTIAGSFGAVSVVISLLFFHEQIFGTELVAILMIFAGILLATLPIEEIMRKQFKFSQGVILAFVTMIIWGIYGVLIKIPVSHIGWFWPNVIIFSLFPPGIYLFTRWQKTKIEKPTNSKELMQVAVWTVMIRTGEFSYNVAVSKGLIAIVAPIASSYPTLFALLAFFIFKDKITKQQIAGILITLSGIVFLSFASS